MLALEMSFHTNLLQELWSRRQQKFLETDLSTPVFFFYGAGFLDASLRLKKLHLSMQAVKLHVFQRS